MKMDSETGGESWKQWLVCPVCKSGLEWRAATVACRGCGRMYPIEDGIPVLLRERAKLAGDGGAE